MICCIIFKVAKDVRIYDKTRYVTFLFLRDWYMLDIQRERNRYGLALSKGTFGIAKGMVLPCETIPFAE